MIEGLDHIVVAAAPADAAVAEYQVLLGRRGAETSFQLGNVRLDVRGGVGADGGGEGLSALGFAVADLAKAQRLLQQRALPVTPAGPGALHIAPSATHGVAISLVSRARAGEALQPSSLAEAEEASAVSGLDHVVIRTSDPERAIALYAGRLGLSLRLDRSEPAWGARLLFFRCGDLVVEVAHDLQAGIGHGPDRLWGLSWRVPDIAMAHARLQSAGVDVSDVRRGRRPGTQVFTVKSHTASVPTLLLGARKEP